MGVLDCERIGEEEGGHSAGAFEGWRMVGIECRQSLIADTGTGSHEGHVKGNASLFFS